VRSTKPVKRTKPVVKRATTTVRTFGGDYVGGDYVGGDHSTDYFGGGDFFGGAKAVHRRPVIKSAVVRRTTTLKPGVRPRVHPVRKVSFTTNSAPAPRKVAPKKATTTSTSILDSVASLLSSPVHAFSPKPAVRKHKSIRKTTKTIKV
jgi:hypothetical protein